MGKAKRDHLAAILANPAVAARWTQHFGSAAGEADIDRVYDKLQPAMMNAAACAAELIPGAAETYAELLRLGVKVGSGTGYTPKMMAAIRKTAAEQGYDPRVVICSGDTPSGRPAPLMIWAALIQLDAWPVRACIKVDDAPVGIAEGREAGCWTVGIAASKNAVGLDHTDFLALSEEERRSRVAAAAQTLFAEGADFVIDDVSQLMPVVHDIARQIPSQ
jgi:phosphonoacetaldehyde hydrolase